MVKYLKISLKAIIEEAKNAQKQDAFKSVDESANPHKANKLVENNQAALTKEQSEEIPLELKEALDMYMKAIDLGQEKDRYKLQYHNDGVKNTSDEIF